MAEKNFNNVRIVSKHDTEANWLKATNFTPKQGEMIVYDKDSTHSYERLKIGDGVQNVNALPFVDDNKVDKVSGKGLSTNDYTTTEKNKLAGIADGANKTVVDSALSASSTNPVQNKVVNTALGNLSDLIGGTKVSEQISTAIAGKSDAGHTHDDKYYTESEVDTKLSSKANTSDLTSHTGNKLNPHNVSLSQLGVTATADELNYVDGVTSNIQTQLNAKVPTSRTVNGKALSANITLSASDVGADASGSSASALTSAKAYTDAEITEWVGDKKVSEQITAAIASKSDSDHTHNYAGSSSAGGAANSVKTNLVVKLNGGSTEGTNLFTYNGSTAKTVNITPSAIGAAASSHGNHVPATETANNAKFLRNDNTWQTVTPENIGAATSSHGTHVSYSTTAPVMDGTASVGSASTVARSDHKHPTDTSRAAASDVATLQSLVGDKKVSEQIAAAQLVYVGPTQPTDPNIKVWINTSEDGTGVIPVLPRISNVSLPVSKWTGGSSPYSQVVEIATVTSATKIDLQPTVAQIVSLQNDDIALMANNDNGVITIYSFGGKPSANMTMQVLLTEVSYV